MGVDEIVHTIAVQITDNQRKVEVVSGKGDVSICNPKNGSIEAAQSNKATVSPCSQAVLDTVRVNIKLTLDSECFKADVCLPYCAAIDTVKGQDLYGTLAVAVHREHIKGTVPVHVVEL